MPRFNLSELKAALSPIKNASIQRHLERVITSLAARVPEFAANLDQALKNGLTFGLRFDSTASRAAFNFRDNLLLLNKDYASPASTKLQRHLKSVLLHEMQHAAHFGLPVPDFFNAAHQSLRRLVRMEKVVGCFIDTGMQGVNRTALTAAAQATQRTSSEFLAPRCSQGGGRMGEIAKLPRGTTELRGALTKMPGAAVIGLRAEGEHFYTFDPRRLRDLARAVGARRDLMPNYKQSLLEMYHNALASPSIIKFWDSLTTAERNVINAVSAARENIHTYQSDKSLRELSTLALKAKQCRLIPSDGSLLPGGVTMDELTRRLHQCGISMGLAEFVKMVEAVPAAGAEHADMVALKKLALRDISGLCDRDIAEVKPAATAKSQTTADSQLVDIPPLDTVEYLRLGAKTAFLAGAISKASSHLANSTSLPKQGAIALQGVITATAMYAAGFEGSEIATTVGLNAFLTLVSDKLSDSIETLLQTGVYAVTAYSVISSPDGLVSGAGFFAAAWVSGVAGSTLGRESSKVVEGACERVMSWIPGLS